MRRRKTVQLERLQTAREIFETKWNCRRSQRDSAAKPSWVCIVEGLLQKAKDVESISVDRAWTFLHEAERFSIYDLDESELLPRITSAKVEAKEKLSNWRKKAVFALLEKDAQPKLEEEAPDSDLVVLKRHQNALVEAMLALQGHYNNMYHRVDLAASQLQVLVVWVCCLIPAIILYFTGFYFSQTPYREASLPWTLGGAALFGALGAVLTAAFQLSRASQKQIPESILTGIITSGRPLIGAASAIFVVVVIHSGLIALVNEKTVILTTYLAVAFVAGFSEHFVIKTAGAVGGDKDKKE